MKEQLDEHLLCDEEITPYALWQDTKPSSSLQRQNNRFLSLLSKFLTDLGFAITILVILAFLFPQFVLSCLQSMPGSRLEYTYKYCEYIVITKVHI